MVAVVPFVALLLDEQWALWPGLAILDFERLLGEDRAHGEGETGPCQSFAPFLSPPLMGCCSQNPLAAGLIPGPHPDAWRIWPGMRKGIPVLYMTKEQRNAGRQGTRVASERGGRRDLAARGGRRDLTTDGWRPVDRGELGGLRDLCVAGDRCQFTTDPRRYRGDCD